VTETPEAIAHSPGKLILSGEHSVLYGAPALAMAIAQYTEVWFHPMSPGEGVRTAFQNLSGGASYPLKMLGQFKSKLDRKFDQFLRGDLEVHKILTRPDDLAVYTLASLLQDAAGDESSEITGIGAVGHLPAPGQLGSRSDLPIGAGMGSSAAVVAATTVLFETLLDRPKTLEGRAKRVRFCERLKHGKAGPIDAAAVVRGGLVKVSDSTLDIPHVAEGHGLLHGRGWYWVLHGRPESSTGDCVSAVRSTHGSDTPLWDAFAACTNALEAALSAGGDAKPALKENQRLLEQIGVVPAATQRFVQELEAIGAAAKICGAGSVAGDFGGAMLVQIDDPEAMTAAMAKHPDFAWSPLKMAKTGAAVGPAPSTAHTPEAKT
jgi:mevalonate kinase